MAKVTHDCLSHYRDRQVVPWTCSECGEVWVVRDRRFVRAKEVESVPQHDHEPVDAGAPCRVCGVSEKEHE